MMCGHSDSIEACHLDDKLNDVYTAITENDVPHRN